MTHHLPPTSSTDDLISYVLTTWLAVGKLQAPLVASVELENDEQAIGYGYAAFERQVLLLPGTDVELRLELRRMTQRASSHGEVGEPEAELVARWECREVAGDLIPFLIRPKRPSTN